MTRLTTIDPAQATGKAKELLDATQAKLGMVPNLMRVLANSPSALQSYLSVSDALNHGLLPGKLRERLAVLVGEANACQYCVSAHTAIGKHLGLSDGELLSARGGIAADAKIEAALRFAQSVMAKKGHVSDEELARVREAGYGDGEIAEIVAHISMNVLSNYFNSVAQTEVDFPKIELLTPARAA